MSLTRRVECVGGSKGIVTHCCHHIHRPVGAMRQYTLHKEPVATGNVAMSLMHSYTNFLMKRRNMLRCGASSTADGESDGEASLQQQDLRSTGLG